MASLVLLIQSNLCTNYAPNGSVYNTLDRLFERLRIPEIVNLVFYILYSVHLLPFCFYFPDSLIPIMFIGTVKYTFIPVQQNNIMRTFLMVRLVGKISGRLCFENMMRSYVLLLVTLVKESTTFGDIGKNCFYVNSV